MQSPKNNPNTRTLSTPKGMRHPHGRAVPSIFFVCFRATRDAKDQPPAKERDTETGNDDFGARYYSPSFGRWLSADWSAIPTPAPYANLTNPQTLNLYAMVRDNPESFADLDGHCWSRAQKLCNFWNYGVWVDDDHLEEALQKEADAARKEFENDNVQRNGQNPDEYLKGKSNKEVLDLWHEYFSSGFKGSLGAVPMFGAEGAQFTSKNVWEKGAERIDVENPNPGKRPGQIHYQEGPRGAEQHIYDPATGKFRGLTETQNEKLLRNPDVQAAIQKALRFLGEAE